MRYKFLLLAVVGVLICNLAYADVPKLINFQGRLTDAAGKFVPDGNYSVTFKLYNDSTGGSSKWSEAQLVLVSKGLFNVILGSVTPIPDSIFGYPNTFLGIQVAVDPEMTPRQRLASLGYSYNSLNSDKLDGLHASDFTSPVSDFGRLGVAADLYEGATALTDKYVNEIGPDGVNSSSGTAFSADVSANDAVHATAVYGTAQNAGTVGAYGVRGEVNSAGSGSQHYAIVGQAYGTSANIFIMGLYGETSGDATGASIGAYTSSSDSGSGDTYGGYFVAGLAGTGTHYGSYCTAAGNSAAESYGTYGSAGNASTGVAYGGYFTTSIHGTGEHYGVYGEANANSSIPAYASYGLGSNVGGGNVYGGSFQADSAGTGYHYGLQARAYGDESSDDAFGVYGYAKNSSSGWTYAGYFNTPAFGTGAHFGTYTSSYGNSGAVTYGSYTYATNASNGDVYGGYFTSASAGTGEHHAVRGVCYGSADSSTYGISGYASNSSTGDVYGGFLETTTSGTGEHYGLRAEGYGASSGLTRGVYGYAENTSTGVATGGRFTSSSSGTGYHYGVYADAIGSSANPTYGIYSSASSTSGGNTYGGYFYASSTSGTEYGVYAYAPATGYAGYFSGDMTATGTKSAAVKVDDGDYRLLYAMESPENWFEDFGEGQLVNGKALVQIDPMFAQSVNTSVKYHVFLTPQDEPLTLAVANRTATSFEVRGPIGSNISFSYRIVAKRKGYEDLRMAKMRGSTPEEMQAEQEKRLAQTEEERAQMKSRRRPTAEDRELRPMPPQTESVRKTRKEQPKIDLEKVKVVSEQR